MLFEWDKEKRIQNIWKHGIDFYDVPSLFSEPAVYTNASRAEDLEQRVKLLVFLEDQLICVIFVMRVNVIRLISARVASKKERTFFAKKRGKYFWEIFHEQQ